MLPRVPWNPLLRGRTTLRASMLSYCKLFKAWMIGRGKGVGDYPHFSWDPILRLNSTGPSVLLLLSAAQVLLVRRLLRSLETQKASAATCTLADPIRYNSTFYVNNSTLLCKSVEIKTHFQDTRDANLSRFQGSASISSDMYFNRLKKNQFCIYHVFKFSCLESYHYAVSDW